MFGCVFTFAVFRDYGYIDTSQQDQFNLIYLTICFGLCFMASLPKKVTALSYISMLASVIVFYVCICVIKDYFCMKDYIVQHKDPEFNLFSPGLNLFTSYCLSLFSVVNQFSVILVMNELKEPTRDRIKNVIFKSAIFPYIIYILIGVLGYLTFGSLTPPIIIERESLPGEYDICMTIGR